MTRSNRIKRLEIEQAKQETPKRVYLRTLFDYLEKKRRGRLGDAVADEEARQLRERLEQIKDSL